MIGYKITTNGTDRAFAMLRKLENTDDLIADALGEWATETLDSELYGMGNYAPPPPNSTYIRTGRLGANWGIQRLSKLAVQFFNLTSYVAYVVGDHLMQRQAAVHAGRWWLGRKKIEARIPRLLDMLQARFRRLQ